jgi:hypothetical protein
MSNERSELAHAALDAFAEEVSPRYDEMREGLYTALSEPVTMAQSLQEADAQSKSNQALIHEFTHALPNVEYGNGAYLAVNAEQVATAGLFQASTIWGAGIFRKVDWKYGAQPMPYYITGRSTDGKESTLLMHDALSRTKDGKPHNEGRLVQVPFKTKELDATLTIMSRNMNHEYNVDEIRSMFSSVSGRLLVGPTTRGSIVMYGDNVSRPEPHTKAKLSPTDTMSIYSHGITNETMQRFDVFTHMNTLAVRFGVEDKLHDLIDKHIE